MHNVIYNIIYIERERNEFNIIYYIKIKVKYNILYIYRNEFEVVGFPTAMASS